MKKSTCRYLYNSGRQNEAPGNQNNAFNQVQFRDLKIGPGPRTEKTPGEAKMRRNEARMRSLGAQKEVRGSQNKTQGNQNETFNLVQFCDLKIGPGPMTEKTPGEAKMRRNEAKVRSLGVQKEVRGSQNKAQGNQNVTFNQVQFRGLKIGPRPMTEKRPRKAKMRPLGNPKEARGSQNEPPGNQNVTFNQVQLFFQIM